MRLRIGIAALLLVCFQATAQEPQPCLDCEPSPQQVHQARQEFERGLRLAEKSRHAEALDAFQEAASLVPRNVEYATAREVTRQKLVFDHISRGNELSHARRRVEALAEFRAALDLDPDNAFARQRLNDALAEFEPQRSLAPVIRSEEVELAPRLGRFDFNFSGDTRGLWEAVAARLGLYVRFDPSVPARQVRFVLDDVSAFQALNIAAKATKTFWVPLTRDHILVAADTRLNRQQLEPMSVRTFYLPDVQTPQELNELVGVLRALFDIRFLTPNATQSALTVRAPKRTLDQAGRFLENLSAARPQVMLDVQIYEVNRTLLRELGVDLPLQFRLFNIPTELRGLLQTPGIQDLIDQLIASGGINQPSPEAIAALLAQLQSQRSPLLGQPIAGFGGGITLMGLLIPPAGINLSLNQTHLARLQSLSLRASHGNAASILIGSRFPVLNATFAPIFNSPELSRVIQDLSFQAAFPSFTFEDLGLSMKVTPHVQGESEVSLQVELKLRALSGQALNSVPVISNREYSGTITVRDGEPAVVAGTLSESEQRTVRGVPGLSHIPVFGRLASTESKETVASDLLVVVTPRIVRRRDPRVTEIWMD